MSFGKHSDAPPMIPFKRHIIVCTGTKCAPDESLALYHHLKERLKELHLHKGNDRIQRSQSQCLGVCAGGPIVVVYPDNIWYHHVDKEKLERIILEHLSEGHPVEEYVLYDGGKATP
jgi:(2Fe-2S) ferredoxin